jgi:hypothetical protein
VGLHESVKGAGYGSLIEIFARGLNIQHYILMLYACARKQDIKTHVRTLVFYWLVRNSIGLV